MTTATTATATEVTADPTALYTSYLDARRFFLEVYEGMIELPLNASQETCERYFQEVFKNAGIISEAIRVFGVELLLEVDGSGVTIREKFFRGLENLWNGARRALYDPDFLSEHLSPSMNVIRCAIADAIGDHFHIDASSNREWRVDYQGGGSLFIMDTDNTEHFRSIITSGELRSLMHLMVVAFPNHNNDDARYSIQIVLNNSSNWASTFVDVTVARNMIEVKLGSDIRYHYGFTDDTDDRATAIDTAFSLFAIKAADLRSA